MRSFRISWLLALSTLLLLGGCATRPVNPRITEFVPNRGYQYQTRVKHSKDPQNLVILAFSGGGTRAAAFSYGVLEALRRTEAVGPKGIKFRLLDEVDIITGVSGGSFTALAYGLYGEKLFDEYEKRFLKRNVQGELISRLFNPTKWGELSSTGWGRSELAAQLYDEILFEGATFADLDRGDGPMISVVATDISTGSRLAFTQGVFDALCSDLGPMRLSRAAAASSAVPVVLSAVTINNYGGTCNYSMPKWVRALAESANPPRPAARAARRLKELEGYSDSAQRPYIHLVDGGVSDNLGLRGALEVIEGFEALHSVGDPTPLDHVHRIIIFVVNSLSSPKTNWDESIDRPNTIETLLKATGVPIDHYSYEAIEQLKDIAARWQSLRRIRASPAFSADKDPSLTEVINAPEIRLYGIDVSFPELKDKAEVEYLNNLPTSFVLPDEAVDRLRAAAAKIILESPEFQRLLKDAGARIVSD
ncbi:MAG TPA: patatin-like phospholipase family protein [Casimicrobiaceae bacterium]|jgi:NTE family protein